ncbi:MAG: hypothetical protein JST89_19780 [Cyanobacteria bacterium SZAS-4]|nr:hypothetical protein [Cyanobacteria bacterium SZAS-4]
MKQQSHRALDLIADLEVVLSKSKRLFFSRKKQDVDCALDLLNEIAKVGSWTCIPDLFQFILQCEIEIAEPAGRCIETLLKKIRPSQLPQLEERLGSGLYLNDRMNSWRALNTFEENKYIASNSCLAVTSLLSFHRIGFIREPASRYLAECTSGAELPYLLIRLADWVPQVRTVAENAIEQRIKPEYLHHFAHNIALIERIKLKQRYHGLAKRTALIVQITNALLQPANRQILLNGLQDKDIDVRRMLLKMVRDSNISDLSEIVDLGVRDKDKTNRHVAIEISNRLPYLERIKLLNQLLSQRSAFIRLESLRTLSDEPTDSSTSQVMKALLDSSSAVRLFARWKLKELDTKIDFRQFYLDQIATNKNVSDIAAAVAGLGEIGSPHDAEKLFPLMLHASVSVQKSAIRTLAKLDVKSYTELFMQKLQSEASGISRAATDALIPMMHIIKVEELWLIFTTTPFPHVKRNAVRLLDKCSQWDRVGYFLLLAVSGDQEFRAIALNKLRCWHDEFRTTWECTKPTAKQTELLTIGVRLFPGELPAKLREILSLSIRVST